MHKIRVMSFTYQNFSIGTDSQGHHMTSVTYHALHPFPVAGEHNLLLPSCYAPCRDVIYMVECTPLLQLFAGNGH